MQGEWIRKPHGATSAVFVHGILSSGETCWRNDNGSYWPDLLKSKPELGSLGIYVFTYQTGIFSGSYRLGDIVDALKEHMRLDGVLESNQLIFVCHSMGGIVVRKFIVERAAELIGAGKEIDLFLVASPSLGSTYADWLSPLAQLFGHAQADALRFVRNNNWLMDLDKEFLNLKEGGKLKIKGKELVEDKFVVLNKFWGRQVVEAFSGSRYFGDPFKVPGSDHFSIAKPKDKTAIQHRLLCKFIMETALSPGPVAQNVRTNLTSAGQKNGPNSYNAPAMPPREIPEKFLVAFSFAGEQRDLVRSIAVAVEERLGRSKVFLDEWYEDYIAGDGADIVLQNIYRERCILAIVCVSACYGGKPWTLAEHAAIRERVNRSRASDSDKDRLGVLPIRVGDGDVEGISPFTSIVPDVRPTERPLDKTVELIVNRLHRAAPEIEKSRDSPRYPAWPEEPTPFEHGLADRAEPWPAIQRLMTADAAKRILMLKGPSGYSKSDLLDAAARYATILGVPAATVDFKDTQFLHRTNVLQRLRLDLGAVLPGFTAAKEPDPWMLLVALRQLSCPALILLDTYEKLTESKELVEWIEIQLLAEVEQCKLLRFLIAGQKVPECSHARWRDLAEEIELSTIDENQAWGDWIRQKYPHIHIDEIAVDAIVRGLKGVPGTISSVLTTYAKTLLRPA
jgi:hypothetical protein